MSATLKSLADARAFVRAESARLDPESRYIRELEAMLDASSDLEELDHRLTCSSRGQRHSGDEVFRAMTLREKLLANLITPETTLFRFTEGELEAIGEDLVPHLRGRLVRVLIVPCSHGEEAFTIAAHLLKLGVEFEVEAFDVQPALIEEARTGRLTFGYPNQFLRTPGLVGEEVLSRIRFQVGDAFALPLPPAAPDGDFDITLCRNFLGYFVPEAALSLTRSLFERVRRGGVLLLDGFCLQKMPELTEDLIGLGARQLRGRPAFVRG